MYTAAGKRDGQTLVNSSLILTHGFPSIEASLMTIFNGLLLPFSLFLSKSFVKKVPIPNVAVQAHVSSNKHWESGDVRIMPASSQAPFNSIALSTSNESENTITF